MRIVLPIAAGPVCIRRLIAGVLDDAFARVGETRSRIGDLRWPLTTVASAGPQVRRKAFVSASM